MKRRVMRDKDSEKNLDLPSDTELQKGSEGYSAELKSSSAGSFFITAPNGKRIEIPGELFRALRDFLETRKLSGNLTISFRSGEIVAVESVARKTHSRTHKDAPSKPQSEAQPELPIDTPFQGSLSEEFDISFDQRLSEEQVATVLMALGNYCRACGGLGIRVRLGESQS